MKIFQRTVVLFSKNNYQKLQKKIFENKIQKILEEGKKTILNGYMGKGMQYEPDEVWSHCLMDIDNERYRYRLKTNNNTKKFNIGAVATKFDDICEKIPAPELVKEIQENLKKIEEEQITLSQQLESLKNANTKV